MRRGYRDDRRHPPRLPGRARPRPSDRRVVERAAQRGEDALARARGGRLVRLERVGEAPAPQRVGRRGPLLHDLPDRFHHVGRERPGRAVVVVPLCPVRPEEASHLAERETSLPERLDEALEDLEARHVARIRVEELVEQPQLRVADRLVGRRRQEPQRPLFLPVVAEEERRVRAPGDPGAEEGVDRRVERQVVERRRPEEEARVPEEDVVDLVHHEDEEVLVARAALRDEVRVQLEHRPALARDRGRRHVAALLDPKEPEERRQLVRARRQGVQEAEGEGLVHARPPSSGK